MLAFFDMRSSEYKVFFSEGPVSPGTFAIMVTGWMGGIVLALIFLLVEKVSSWIFTELWHKRKERSNHP